MVRRRGPVLVLMLFLSACGQMRTVRHDPVKQPHAKSTALALDFDGPAGTQPFLNALHYRTGGNGWGNNEIESYTSRSENAALDGRGHLVLRAIREPIIGPDGIRRDWTSARLDTLGSWSFTTGTVSARMRLPAGHGLWPAFWLEGDDLPRVGWPACGEVDVMEAPLGDHRVFQTLHGPTQASRYQVGTDTRLHDGGAGADGYHVFSVTRAPSSIRFQIDGKTTATYTPDDLEPGQRWIYDKPMFVIVNLAVGGWAGNPTPDTSSESELSIDWIRFAPLER